MYEKKAKNMDEHESARRVNYFWKTLDVCGGLRYAFGGQSRKSVRFRKVLWTGSGRHSGVLITSV